MKKLLFLSLFFLFAILVPKTFAQGNSFVSVVNPVRGEDFWESKDQFPQTAILGQIDILKRYRVSATWLIRYDALVNKDIISSLDIAQNDERGLFLEISPTWAKDSGVNYHQGSSWHAADSAFLTGYERRERERLIDVAFGKFKETFGYYPKSVGAWWVDGYSLEYMQKKYGILGSLIVADQYTTDNYQIWGQYWSTPYYPSKKNALHPASNQEDKLPVVMMQWASRDPVNGYGNGVLESTFSVQANDYSDYHDLGTPYFSKLVDIYTTQPMNSLNHLIIGLENSYSWSKYKGEYENQIKVLAQKSKNGQFKVVSMEEFAGWYLQNFPDFSPAQIIIANDPLGSFKKSVWFMNPYYRVGWFFNQDGSVIRDIRQYVGGEEEICYKKSCNQLNFATFATRVLDDVTYHTKWVIDEGKISNFKVSKNGENYTISYNNEAGKSSNISFLSRDLQVNGKISSIDGAILDAISKSNKIAETTTSSNIGSGKINFSIFAKVIRLLEFLLFISLAIFLPGYLFAERINTGAKTLKDVFLSVAIGLVLFTIFFYLLSVLRLKFLIFIFPLFGIGSLILKNKQIMEILKNLRFNFETLPVLLVTILGTIFQIIPVFKSGLKYDFGVGFWGPNTHDGVWHVALINQLLKDVPPQNPIFANEALKNYHYLYDLLVAATSYVTQIDVLDLVFRFYPILFSLLLGIGTYYLCAYIFQDKKANRYWAATISLFLVYFSGSLGWIVEFITQKHLGGESAFWANQAVSFNLNPPFAISLIFMIGIILLISKRKFSKLAVLVIALIAGSLIGFKAYAAIIVLGSLFITALASFLIYKQSKLLLIVLLSLILSGVFLVTNGVGGAIFQFSPLWFVNSMIDSPDRVGWNRLSIARYYSIEREEWFKFIGVESLGLAIFLIGNLNARVIGLLKILDFNRIKKETAYFFVFCLAGISLLIPLFYIQSGTPWNTIQFLYYFMYLCAVFTGPAIVFYLRSKYKYVGIPLIALLLLLSPMNSITTARGYLWPLPHARVSNLELAGLEFLSKQPDGVVLTYPYDKNLKSKLPEPWPIVAYDTTAYVAAFAKKAVFIEDQSQNDILLTDYKKRLIASKDFFLDPNADFLIANKIKYVYIPKINKESLDESSLPITKIFDNSEVGIYQVNK